MTPPVPAMPQEGYYKFTPHFVGRLDADAALIAALNAERERLVARGLIGQYAAGPLAGVGFGNLSARTPGGFLITATSTGGLARLGAEHYTEIVGFDLARNCVEYRALTEAVKPSSECMTHGVCYQADVAIGAVAHVHHRELWRRLLDRVPTTAHTVPYGTPEMGAEILRLYRESDLRRRRLAVMGGHEEGLLGLGATPAEATAVLLAAFDTLPPEGC